jgi:signal transduction histidine kinase
VKLGSTARLCLLALLAVRGVPAEALEPWRILILQATEPLNPAAMEIDEALRATLVAGAARPIAFHTEFLDSVGFDTSRFEPERIALFRKKYADVPFDLVVGVGPDAVAFAERHRAEMWPHAAVVFTGISQVAEAAPAAGPGTTGVRIAFDEPGTLALARRLQPAARRLVVICGASDYDHGWLPPLREAVRRYGEGLDVAWSVGEPLPDVLRTVSGLPGNAIVVYTTVGRDGRGVRYVPRDVAAQVARASTAPVYSVVDTHLGHGVVGGSVPSMAAQGRNAGELALRVLSGEKASAIPVEPAPAAVVMVDWRELRRFGLSDGALPAGAVVRFRPPSLWDQYGRLVLAVALVLAVQTGLIVALLVQSRRRRRAELAAQRQRAKLAHASRLNAVGQLTASIAHEINQPLGAILANAEAAEMFLEAEPPQLDRVKQILADIGHEDRRASEVIHHVRSLLRKAPPEMRTLALNDVAREVLDLVGGDARRRGVVLQAELDAALPPIRGDRVLLQQALLNLVLNGMEAIEQSANGDRRIVVRTVPAGDAAVELVVEDSGPGIPAERLPQLFESFFTTKKDGMGLGLSIVRSIAEAHGGRIEAGNGGASGAVFRLRLPAAPPDASAPGL